ncbi:uncharacterized protein LOC134107167 [Pungitius pungitius]|uniref:uncharacterized protein LOC134107167 n=1 Tax=Pungitius pungitius TaxID=134920 RepID=UPI002E0D199A
MLQRHEQQLHFMAEAMQSMSARHESSMESLRDHLRNLAVVTRTPDVTPAAAQAPTSAPIKRQGSPVNQRALVSREVRLEMPSRPRIHAQLFFQDKSYTVPVLIDSGADANLLDQDLAFKMGIEQIALERPIRATALDGRLLCRVTHQTTPLRLEMSDPARQFVVEVDASDTGVGAVLSQRSSTDQKVHPCAFFSRKLSATERNYDIGDRELLAVKLALEEWRHWLEGADQPFMVWTDHKNLEYIRSAKRLNSRQASGLGGGRGSKTVSYSATGTECLPR